MAENMVLSAFLVMLIYLLASCAAKQNSSEIQCKLLPVREDVASEFQSLKKNGVRMIYLKLTIQGDDSYHPLELQNEFLPDRWVWAATIDELMLSLSYDYDILSLGLLKRQVRQMDVQLKEEPSGCLAAWWSFCALNSSCHNIVVAQALFGNVTSKDASGTHLSEDVVCVDGINTSFDFFDNFFDGDVESRCCERVKQGRLPKCELSVQRSNWFKAFYVVLNVLTVFMGIYSPALFFLLPDYIFDVRKECEKEHQQEEEEKKKKQKEEIKRRLRQNGYQHIPSSQEQQETIAEERSNANDDERIILSRLRRPANDPNSNEPNTNEQNSMVPNLNDPNSNEPNSNEPNSNDPDSNQPNSVDPNSNERSNTNEPNSNGPVTSSLTKKEEEEKRKVDEFPLDDGSPFNISTLIYTCKSAEVFRDYSTKLSFNIKLAFLWFCVIPVFFYTELALGYTLKDEYLEEMARNDAAFLVGGLFIILDMTELTNRVILVVSYVVIPFIIILLLRPKDLNEERKRSITKVDTPGETKLTMITHKVYIGEQVLQRVKKNREIVDKILPFLAKVPIIVHKTIQNVCDDYIKIGAPRELRFFWVLLKTLFLSVCAVMCSVIAAAICLFLMLLCTTAVLVFCSPYPIIIWYFRYKLIRRWLIFFVGVFLVGMVELLLPLFTDIPQLLMYNPLVYLLFLITGPFFLIFYSCRFVVKMFGYTIMGLILNADIMAPVVTFFATVTMYLHDCYSNSQNKYKKVKEIISQEWQKEVKDRGEAGLLNENQEPNVTNDTVPKKLFWYVCDSDDWKVIPVEKEAFLMLRNMAIIFFSAFLALCAIFFATDSYKISPVASTIAVFVSGRIPMVLLRGTDKFNGWEKIKTKREIREAVGEFIDKKLWLEPAMNQEQAFAVVTSVS